MIFDEPVRGRIPQPWFWALRGRADTSYLSGFAAITAGRALAGGPGPLTLGTGLGTWTMPAAGMFETEAGTLSYFRPMRPEPGNLLARARVINASRFFVFSEVEIEDPQGRLIARASSHLELRRIEPPPPAELHSIASVSSPASRCNASPGKRMTGIPLCGCSPRAPSGHHIDTALRGVGERGAGPERQRSHVRIVSGAPEKRGPHVPGLWRSISWSWLAGIADGSFAPGCPSC
jgi:hypothetical protein